MGSSDTGNQNAFAHRDVWQWLINYGIPRNKTDGQPDKAFLDLCNIRKSKSSSQKPDLSHKEESWLLLQFPELSYFTDPELLD